MNPELSVILVFFVFVWLLVITILLTKVLKRYYKLSGGGGNKDLGAVLEKLMADLKGQNKEIQELHGRSDKAEKKATAHIQKIGLVRYNPFTGTGGNQSFALAILDGKDTGVVISGLHSRDNTRLYTKLVKKGKPVKHEFSKEEKQAITQAQKQ